jgi:hypothetical protein
VGDIIPQVDQNAICRQSDSFRFAVRNLTEGAASLIAAFWRQPRKTAALCLSLAKIIVRMNVNAINVIRFPTPGVAA